MALHALFKPKDKADLLKRIEQGEPLLRKGQPLPLAEPQRPVESTGQADAPVVARPKGHKPPGMFVMAFDPFSYHPSIDSETVRVTQDLFDAIEENNLAKAKLAITSGADIHSAHPLWNRGGGEAPTIRCLNEQVTPLQYARERNVPEIAKLLKSAGAQG